MMNPETVWEGLANLSNYPSTKRLDAVRITRCEWFSPPGSTRIRSSLIVEKLGRDAQGKSAWFLVKPRAQVAILEAYILQALTAKESGNEGNHTTDIAADSE